MPVDPTDLGAVALASRIVTPEDRSRFDFALGGHRFTPEQVRRYNRALVDHRATVRLDLLEEGWIRLSVISREGDAMGEDSYLAPGSQRK